MSRRCRILTIDRSFLLPNSTLLSSPFLRRILLRLQRAARLHCTLQCHVFIRGDTFAFPAIATPNWLIAECPSFTDSHTDPVVTVIQCGTRSGKVVCYLPSQLKGWKGYCLSPSYRTPLAPCISPQSETQEFSSIGRGRQGTLGQGNALGHFDR